MQKQYVKNKPWFVAVGCCWSEAFRLFSICVTVISFLAVILRQAIVSGHRSGKCHKAISRQFEVHHSTVRNTIHKWKAFKAVASLPRSRLLSKFTPRSDCAQRNCKKPKSPVSLRASVIIVNLKVYDSPIRKRQTKYEWFGKALSF